MAINEELKKLYSDNIEGIKEISDKSDITDNGESYSKWDGPILMHCWEQHYDDAKFKILFIGQEPNKWIERAWDEIEEPLKRYEEFALARETKDVTTIWRAIFEINKMLNPNSENTQNFLWTDVSKYSTWEGKKINDSDFKFINKRFNVLQEEIKIIDPSVIIFFSGPDYDQWIKDQFKGNITFDEHLLQDIPKRELSIVRLDSEKQLLPVHTYRTYHPGFLSYSNKWYFLNAIALHCMGFNLESIVKKLKDDFYNLQDVIIDEHEINNRLGSKEWTLKLKIPKWEHFSIGFQFQDDGFRSFFYGILNDRKTYHKGLLDQISTLQNNNEAPSELWPYWNWYEQKNWDKKIYKLIKWGNSITF